MNNSTVFTRSSKQDIGDYAKLLYEEVLLICESSELNKLKGASIAGTAFTHPLKDRVILEYNDTPKIYKGSFELKSQRWVLKKSIKVKSLDNKICFVSSGNKIICLLKHMRNAFAHNLVVVEGEYIILGDFLQSKHKPNFSQPTMLGRLSCENFKLLISTIHSMKNENNYPKKK